MCSQRFPVMILEFCVDPPIRKRRFTVLEASLQPDYKSLGEGETSQPLHINFSKKKKEKKKRSY